MFGRDFGVESETRDSTHHATGRRHGAREMTNESGIPLSAADNTVLARDEFNRKRALDESNIANAPSFMQSMGEKSAAASEHASHPAPPVSRTAGKDTLNLFSWEGPIEKKPHRRSSGVEKSEAEINSLRPVHDSVHRNMDAQKFEQHKDTSFLHFSENQPRPGRRTLSPQNTQPPFAMDQPVAPNQVPGAGPAPPHMRRQFPGSSGATPASQQPSSIDGFPGLGGANAFKNPSPALNKKPISSVFNLPIDPVQSDTEAAQIQRMHQSRTKAEVGTATVGRAAPRHMGGYTTSNGSYGVVQTSAGRVIPKEVLTGGSAPWSTQPQAPSAYRGTGGESGAAEGGVTGNMSRDYERESLHEHPLGEVGYGHRDYAPSHLSNNPVPQGIPSTAPEARESTLPEFLQEQTRGGANSLQALQEHDRELEAYEQLLRERLRQARRKEEGMNHMGGSQDRGEGVSYDYSPANGFVETPRDGGAPWIDEGANGLPNTQDYRDEKVRHVQFSN